ncbi:amino acid aminotransferase [Pantoea sp. Nvir]|uniref:amino acid aminotransferase n=1 Tax=Pantoea sp. Nvir TaxID=2576760 RepID=UPI001356C8B2|nr:amino acid aminotransferase [Pantoea sp. Nvir]MXP66278.1 aspartate/tyrosine/aromatic aminotransferase [Pantoea sp. Nvir]CAJ0991499.1 Aspartate aminotransferase [Pantoea sp. Nvir]
MFEFIPAAPADPILGLADLFYADDRPQKINLGIGIYKDEIGNTPVLTSVKKAEKYLLENETTKNYLSIEGLTDFVHHTQDLLFGAKNLLITSGRVRTAQTPGGTSALRIAADFLATQTSVKRVWISNPSWPNHKNVFTSACLEVCEYAYYDAKNHILNFDGILDALQEAKVGDVVLFHGCCHNPTGIDPTVDQWNQLAQLSHAKGWLPLFDISYQGFARGLHEDAEGLRIFAALNQELIIASSYSKNFSLYNERVGAITLVAADAATVDIAFSQVKYIIRANYSNPPVHGAAIVATILSSQVLRTIWEKELSDMRLRIQHMRRLFVNTLSEKGSLHDFSFIIQQNGMFSFSGLTEKQVIRLRNDFGIYAVHSGRINIAGITPDNISILCKAIIAVMR